MVMVGMSIEALRMVETLIYVISVNLLQCKIEGLGLEWMV